MTFLELCGLLRQEAGISGSWPSTVVNQTGENGRIVNWIRRAWHEIQLSNKHWYFLRGEFSFDTTIDQSVYMPVQAGIAERFNGWDIDSFKMFLTLVGFNDERSLVYLPYEDFRRQFLTGQRLVTRPLYITFNPSLELVLGDIPDAVYTVSGEYFKKPQILASAVSDDNNVRPDMPEEYHMLIVYEALRKYAMFEAAPEVLAYAKEEASKIRNALESNQLPTIQLAEPMV